MLCSQQNQISILEEMLNQKDNLLKEKEVFSKLQATEIGLLRKVISPCKA